MSMGCILLLMYWMNWITILRPVLGTIKTTFSSKNNSMSILSIKFDTQNFSLCLFFIGLCNWCLLHITEVKYISKFQYPDMMMAPTTQPTQSTTAGSSPSHSASPNSVSSCTVIRSATPKLGTPVRNVRARTQVEVAQAALILSRIEDMKGKLKSKKLPEIIT